MPIDFNMQSRGFAEAYSYTRGNDMPPTMTKQTPPKFKPAVNNVPASLDILSTGTPVDQISDLYVYLALYGRNRVGKTTLACQDKKPLCLISVDPSPTGGTRSVRKTPGITVYQVSNKPMKGADGRFEDVWGSAKVLAIIAALKARFDAGERPFESIVLDGVTSWNDIVLQELMGVDASDVKGIIGFGDVSQDTYRDRAERLIRYMRPLFDMPCNVTVIAQEKDHNPPKEGNRVLGTKLIRPMQLESFYSLAIGDSPCLFLQNACDFVCQLYEDAELEPYQNPDVTIGTAVKKGEVTMVPTGRRARHLRMQYHPNFAAGPRSPDHASVPEAIVGGTPAEMWAAFQQVVRGEKTARGKYN